MTTRIASSVRALASELRADAGSAMLPTALSTGLITAVIVLVGEAAIASIVFSNPLSPLIPRGTGAILFGTLVMCFLTALACTYKATISVPHFAPAAVLLTIGAAVAAVMVSASGEAVFATMIVIVGTVDRGDGDLLFAHRVVRARLSAPLHALPPGGRVSRRARLVPGQEQHRGGELNHDDVGDAADAGRGRHDPEVGARACSMAPCCSPSPRSGPTISACPDRRCSRPGSAMRYSSPSTFPSRKPPRRASCSRGYRPAPPGHPSGWTISLRWTGVSRPRSFPASWQ